MIEQAIHHRWAASAGLVAWIPPDRFTTGPRLDDDRALPAAMLTIDTTQTTRTSTSRAKRRGCRIQYWCQEHYDGVQIRKQIDAAFDNAQWDVVDEDDTVLCRVLSSRIENDFWLQEDDGVLQFVVDLELLTNHQDA